VQHLAGKGHRRIAHVGGPQSMVHGRSRLEAWRDALQDLGLPRGPYVEADFSADAGASATRQLLDLDPRPTAIVFANDLMAMAGLSVAMQRGIDVPGDLSITGFDDTELAQHVVPALTTVHVDVTRWGAAAARRLLALIDGRPSATPDLDPPWLVVRASTGPAPPPHGANASSTATQTIGDNP
jgi:DNA-binding LacI/PurR family transcriptional regulator